MCVCVAESLEEGFRWLECQVIVSQTSFVWMVGDDKSVKIQLLSMYTERSQTFLGQSLCSSDLRDTQTKELRICHQKPSTSSLNGSVGSSTESFRWTRLAHVNPCLWHFCQATWLIICTLSVPSKTSPSDFNCTKSCVYPKQRAP